MQQRRTLTLIPIAVCLILQRDLLDLPYDRPKPNPDPNPNAAMQIKP